MVVSTDGEVWKGDESALQIMARRGALSDSLRGEATERMPGPRGFMFCCGAQCIGVVRDFIKR